MDLFLRALLFHLFLILPLYALLPITDLYNGVPQSRGLQTVTLNGVQPAVWTNQPLALTELAGSRIAFDLSGGLQVRISTNVIVVGAAAARVGAQCSNDGGSTWHFFDDGTQPNVQINTTGPKQSAWIDIIAACRADGTLIRVGGQGGDGALDPSFGLTLLEFR